MNFSGVTAPIDLKIQIVVCEIESNFARSWSAEELARLVSLSPSRLRHLFKSQTGEAPMRYLKSRRMQEAAVLLRMMTLSVKQIMHRVGMTDASNFVHEFERGFGVSPSMYRRLQAAFSSGRDPSAKKVAVSTKK